MANSTELSQYLVEFGDSCCNLSIEHEACNKHESRCKSTGKAQGISKHDSSIYHSFCHCLMNLQIEYI